MCSKIINWGRKNLWFTSYVHFCGFGGHFGGHLDFFYYIDRFTCLLIYFYHILHEFLVILIYNLCLQPFLYAIFRFQAAYIEKYQMAEDQARLLTNVAEEELLEPGLCELVEYSVEGIHVIMSYVKFVHLARVLPN